VNENSVFVQLFLLSSSEGASLLGSSSVNKYVATGLDQPHYGRERSARPTSGLDKRRFDPLSAARLDSAGKLLDCIGSKPLGGYGESVQAS